MLAFHHPSALVFGVLGIILNFVLYLSPLPTFYTIYLNKTTAGFEALPYLLGWLCNALWVSYALLIRDSILLISSITGLALRSLYMFLYLIYAPHMARRVTCWQLALCCALLGASLLVSLVGGTRIMVLGILSSVAAVAAFAAPLSIVRQVIATKSVQYMPLWQSMFLTLGACMWSAYGFIRRDIYIIIPSVLGVFLGAIQLTIYAIYCGNEQSEGERNEEPGL